MAEGQGFEPWEGFHLRRFSRPVHSTALPSLHGGQYYRKLERSQWLKTHQLTFFELAGVVQRELTGMIAGEEGLSV